MKNFMRKNSFLFFSIFCLTSVLSCSAQDTLTVISYNIYHAEHPQETQSTVQKIADFISDIDPDFVSLQEVDSMTARLGELHSSHTFDLADSLAKLSGMSSYYGKALDFDGGGYGMAILSRKSLEPQKIELPNPKEGESRVLLYLHTTDDSPVIFGATHLDHQYQENRLKQVEAINQQFELEEKPIILAGDFNFEPNTKGYKMMQELWIDAADDQAVSTYPTENPEKRIDYIWLSENVDWEVLNLQTINIDYSDHLPIMAKVVVY